ncbi:MAG: type II toxin-antitoxin system Phd/YefM family antitoxin [Endozoicomonas sp.]|uniref:type II toxin-antitoxin system Phd/YefM family antitoxin n=1 Tax=Endozoicomonas sp. TaxID=1892382 RepID=UPI003D9BE1D1
MSDSQQITVGMHEAKSRLSELVRLALEEDADIVITQRNKPVMRLVPYEEQPESRGFGALKGQIEISEDFDTTPDDIVDQFYGDSDQ